MQGILCFCFYLYIIQSQLKLKIIKFLFKFILFKNPIHIRFIALEKASLNVNWIEFKQDEIIDAFGVAILNLKGYIHLR